MRAQSLDVFRPHLLRCGRQLGSKIQHGAVSRFQLDLPEIARKSGDKGVVVGQSPETLRVVGQSVVTLVQCRNHDGDHLTASAR